MPKTINHNGNIITEYEGAEAQEFINNWMMEVTETDNMEDAHMAFVAPVEPARANGTAWRIDRS